MKTAMKRSLALLLAVCMAALCAPMAALPAARAAESTKALHLVADGPNGPRANNVIGGQVHRIWFGKYKQSKPGSTFNVDPIKWRVLSNSGGKLFLMADQNLDALQYHTSLVSNIKWDTCTLRKWLNGYEGNPYDDSFIASAFSAKEAAAVAETTIVNQNLPDTMLPANNTTTDKVFLLSYYDMDEWEYEFRNERPETRVATNTEYVHSGREGTTMNAAGEADVWWLRTPGGGLSASSVKADGSVGVSAITQVGVAVRPVFLPGSEQSSLHLRRSER